GAAEVKELVHQPLGGTTAISGVRRQRADARDGEEVGEFGEEARRFALDELRIHVGAVRSWRRSGAAAIYSGSGSATGSIGATSVNARSTPHGSTSPASSSAALSPNTAT